MTKSYNFVQMVSSDTSLNDSIFATNPINKKVFDFVYDIYSDYTYPGIWLFIGGTSFDLFPGFFRQEDLERAEIFV